MMMMMMRGKIKSDAELQREIFFWMGEKISPFEMLQTPTWTSLFTKTGQRLVFYFIFFNSFFSLASCFHFILILFQTKKSIIINILSFVLKKIGEREQVW